MMYLEQDINKVRPITTLCSICKGKYRSVCQVPVVMLPLRYAIFISL